MAGIVIVISGETCIKHLLYTYLWFVKVCFLAGFLGFQAYIVYIFSTCPEQMQKIIL